MLKQLIAATVLLAGTGAQADEDNSNSPTRWTFKSQLEEAELLTIECEGRARGLRRNIQARVLLFEKQGYEFSRYTNKSRGLNAAAWRCKAEFKALNNSCRDSSNEVAPSQFSTELGENILLEIKENQDGCLELQKGEWTPEVELNETPFEGEAFEDPESYDKYDFNNFTVGITSSEEGDYRQFSCTGILIGPRTVLTAAHCVANSKSFSITFANHTPRQTTVSSRSFISHPGYIPVSSRGPGESDAALIFLDKDAKGFLPIEAPSESPEEGDTVFMAGYGSFGVGANGSFIPNSTKELDGLEAYVLRQSERFLDYQNDQGKSSCAGDSGGPMVEIDPDTGDFVLVGITRGPVLGDRQSMACRYRGQYTNYQFVASWIEENIR